MLGARVGGDLILAGGRFSNPGGHALSLDRTAIEGGLFCTNGFSAEGEVRLLAARVGSAVDLSGGRLVNANRRALSADRLAVQGDLFCREGFHAEGEVRLLGVRVGGQLSFRGTIDTSPGVLALDLEEAQIARVLFLEPTEPLHGWVDLTNAQVGVLRDSAAAWTGGVELRGMRYDMLGEPPQREPGRWWRRDRALHERLGWLRGNLSGYHPQIYEQLAAHYRAVGHESRERAVLIHKQRRQRKETSYPTRVWSTAVDLLVGYGYRTWQAIIPWVALLVSGTVFFAHHMRDIRPRSPTQTPPTFHALTYTLDLLLPVVNLGQRDNWVARHGAQTFATILILAGWVLTTAILAALTGLVRRTR